MSVALEVVDPIMREVDGGTLIGTRRSTVQGAYLVAR
jgi:hypothetical protein